LKQSIQIILNPGGNKMPIVQISILPQSTEKKAEMSKVITDEINRITGIRKEAILIAFYELPTDNFATNGETLTEQFKRKH
jgi:4-oxalocrotonate tautomerase family enzyme